MLVHGLRNSPAVNPELRGGHIGAAFGLQLNIDLLGFSIDGVITRTRRFISVECPQQGTLAVLPVWAHPQLLRP